MPGVLVEANQAWLDFGHDSFLARAAGRGSFFSVRSSSLLLRNDLFVAQAAGANLLSTDRPPTQGSIQACAFFGFESYLQGVQNLRDLAALGRLVLPKDAPPLLALMAKDLPVQGGKGDWLLPAQSRLLDAGLPLGEEAYARDFAGLPRPSDRGRGLPDIGADELR
jgi:hypothetical protein